MMNDFELHFKDTKLQQGRQGREMKFIVTETGRSLPLDAGSALSGFDSFEELEAWKVEIIDRRKHVLLQ